MTCRLTSRRTQTVIDFFASFDKDSYLTIFSFLGIGTVLTFCMQSSAALMAITMVLCSSGVLPIYMGIALVLGENIGTTITSNIAAMGANTQARRAAFAHLTFNVFGVIWVLCGFYPFIDMVCGFVGVNPHADHIDAARLSVVLAASERLVDLAEKIKLQQEALKNGAAQGATTATAAEPEWRKADVAERLSTALVKERTD